MGKADLDKSQLDRQLLGDLAALIAVKGYLEANSPATEASTARSLTLARVTFEIDALVKDLWPTG